MDLLQYFYRVALHLQNNNLRQTYNLRVHIKIYVYIV